MRAGIAIYGMFLAIILPPSKKSKSVVLVVAVAVGLLLSFHQDLAAGATIVLVEVGIFFVVLIARSLPRPRGQAA